MSIEEKKGFKILINSILLSLFMKFIIFRLFMIDDFGYATLIILCLFFIGVFTFYYNKYSIGLNIYLCGAIVGLLIPMQEIDIRLRLIIGLPFAIYILLYMLACFFAIEKKTYMNTRFQIYDDLSKKMNLLETDGEKFLINKVNYQTISTMQKNAFLQNIMIKYKYKKCEIKVNIDISLSSSVITGKEHADLIYCRAVSDSERININSIYEDKDYVVFNLAINIPSPRFRATLKLIEILSKIGIEDNILSANYKYETLYKIETVKFPKTILI